VAVGRRHEFAHGDATRGSIQASYIPTQYIKVWRYHDGVVLLRRSRRRARSTT
jgi:hypothetical protein